MRREGHVSLYAILISALDESEWLPPAVLSPGNWLRYPLNRNVSVLRSGGLETFENRKNPCPCQQTDCASSVVPFVARINTAAAAICH